MNEREWLACIDPGLMLSELPGGVTDRKLRLFAVACCRRIWHLLPDRRSREAVEVAERCADGLAGRREQGAALAAALAATGRTTERAAWAAYWAANRKPAESIWNACEAAVDAVARDAARSARSAGEDLVAAWHAALAEGAREQARLLREVLGNPFRPAAVDPDCLGWRDGLVVAIARQMYEQHDFSAMPVLADALEDAGCDDPELLAHCRLAEGHVKGCWALDLLLQKE